jgi:hypothetical protein
MIVSKQFKKTKQSTSTYQKFPQKQGTNLTPFVLMCFTFWALEPHQNVGHVAQLHLLSMPKASLPSITKDD